VGTSAVLKRAASQISQRWNSNPEPSLIEIITGRPRPRHLRFAASIMDLVPGVRLERRDKSRLTRLRINAEARLAGIRQARFSRVNAPILLHQALAVTRQPYAAEYDVPMAIHGYNYSSYLRHADKARRLLEHDSLRMLFVFSNWAKRSFALHFGEAAASKCVISYPLASNKADHSRRTRRYDFTFIARAFRIKGGPELLRAFRSIRHSSLADAKLCAVTNLKEAAEVMGDLTTYEGVDWHPANLDETTIATLLNDTHCLVHPTLWESFGVVVLEALASGCAIITSNMASLPELVSNDNGILLRPPIGLVIGEMTVPQFSNGPHFAKLLDRLNLNSLEQDLAAAMAAIAGDPARRSKYQENSRDLYERCFSLGAWQKSMRVNLSTAFPGLTTH
jgi:glycosyltransferase involved in cell wall biosynthesis